MSMPLSSQLLEQLISELKLTSTDTETRCRVEQAARFYADHMAMEDTQCMVSHLHGIDFSDPVEQLELQCGQQLMAFRPVEHAWDKSDPFGCYFTDVGTDHRSVGIRPEDARHRIYYVVQTPVQALRSRVKSGYVPEKGHVNGGANQYCVAQASRHLAVADVRRTG